MTAEDAAASRLHFMQMSSASEGDFPTEPRSFRRTCGRGVLISFLACSEFLARLEYKFGLCTLLNLRLLKNIVTFENGVVLR